MKEEDKDVKDVKDEIQEEQYCSFCGKSVNEVLKLIEGPSVFICDECTDLCSEIIQEEYRHTNSPEDLRGEYIYELLEEHFKPDKLNALETLSRHFSVKQRSTIEKNILEYIKENKIRYKFVGIGHCYNTSLIEVDFSGLWEQGQLPFLAGPTQYEIFEPKKGIEERCLKNGLWLCINKGISFAIYIEYRNQRGNKPESIYLEIAAKDLDYIEKIFMLIQLKGMNNT